MLKNNIIKVIDNEIIKICAGFALAITICFFTASYVEKQGELKDAALGIGTTLVRGVVDGAPVHCEGNSDIFKCIDAYDNTNDIEKTILWLGNSQLHAINQMTDGDKPAPGILHEALKDSKSYLLTMSQGNANLQEHLVLSNYLMETIDIDLIILPIFFDDLRETGIRNDVSNLYARSGYFKEKSKLIRATLKASGILEKGQINDAINKSFNSDLLGLQGSIQEHSERYLSHQLAEWSNFWRLQPEIRGNIQLALYRLRNTIFGITASTIRRVIPVRYTKNLLALDELLSIATKKNIKLLIYLPPIRNDVKIPYDSHEYSLFKEDVKRILSGYKLKFYDYERVVSNDFWGMKDSTNSSDELELDFMHFQSGGHHQLAKVLEQDIKNILELETKHDF